MAAPTRQTRTIIVSCPDALPHAAIGPLSISSQTLPSLLSSLAPLALVPVAGSVIPVFPLTTLSQIRQVLFSHRQTRQNYLHRERRLRFRLAADFCLFPPPRRDIRSLLRTDPTTVQAPSDQSSAAAKQQQKRRQQQNLTLCSLKPVEAARRRHQTV